MPIFAFTDIEGSTGLWERHREAMGAVIAKHYAILEEVLARSGGKVIKKTGDGIFALFPDEDGSAPSKALGCALEWQARFQAEAWPVVGELRVRMAFHCGQAEEMGGDYYGPTANRTARFMALGWGGQILVSSDLQRVAQLPAGADWQDLGVHQVKDLPEPQHVFGLRHPRLRLQEFPALKSLSKHPHNLPEQRSPLAGRRRELQQLAGLFTGAHSRLVSLVGGGGMGKSRLAIQAALDNLPAFKHGVTLAGLGGVVGSAALAERIAHALKLGLYRDLAAREQVLDYLRERELLLILDPCERLGEGTAFVAALLERCPGLRILAVSRKRLELGGESVLPLEGLDYPEQAPVEGFSSFSAVQLFMRAAQAVQPGYSLGYADQAAFVRLCRSLRGQPLGLELAANALRSLPLQALAERLERDPRVLGSTRQDLPPSHRSLSALFASEWDDLDAVQRKALAAVSAFQGGLSPANAQRALQLDPAVLAALQEHGLLERGEEGRLSVPQTARHFAAQKLEADPALRDAVYDQHAKHYLRLLREREKALAGHGQSPAVAELREELANLGRAWDRGLLRGWAHENGQAARGAGLLCALLGLARDWEPRFERALALWDGPVAVPPEESLLSQAALWAAFGDAAFSLGQGAKAKERMEKSLACCRKAGPRANGGVAYALVRMAIFLGPEDERRRPALEEAAGLYEGLGDANGAAWARRNLGYFLCLQGKAAEGKPLLEASLAVFRQVGHTREIAWSLNSLGQAELEAGHGVEGQTHLREARELFDELGDIEMAGWTLQRLGRAAAQAGAWDEARACLEESLARFTQLRHPRGRAQALRGLCEAFAAKGDLASAFAALDKMASEAAAAGDLAGQAAALVQKGQLQAIRGEAGEALSAFQSAQAAFLKAGSEPGQVQALEQQAAVQVRAGASKEGRALLEQALDKAQKAVLIEAEARLCVRLGELDAAEGRGGDGEGWFKRALRISRQHKPGDYSLGALIGLSRAQLKQNRKLEALQAALLCERSLTARIMPPTDPDFYGELKGKAEAALNAAVAKLLRNVTDEARGRLEGTDLRAQLKELIEKSWA